jgi:hypothetical protein
MRNLQEEEEEEAVDKNKNAVGWEVACRQKHSVLYPDDFAHCSFSHDVPVDSDLAHNLCQYEGFCKSTTIGWLELGISMRSRRTECC